MLFFLVSLLPLDAQVVRKSLVEFYSSDSLLVSADHYYSNKKNPYIVLFHQEGSSRGEFESIAERFAKMKYNCLAVDLRNGDKFGYVDNLTAKRARENNLPTGMATERDIVAAIDYAYRLSFKKPILLGSSWSASLILKAGAEDERVKAIMAFSPGEFLQPLYSLDSLFAITQKPVYVACNQQEYSYLMNAVQKVPEGNLSMITPPQKSQSRGIPMLFETNPGHNEYWLSVLIFIKSLQN